VSDQVVDLGDGLALRRGSAADAARAVDLAREVLTDPDGGVDTGVVLWTADLFDRPPPGFDPSLFTLVEDTTSGRLASMLCLIPQTWTYSGIPIEVGRVELVATRPEYRRRGLVRAQIDTVHGWSASMGHLAQAITGIPWFYRRFGYEMALDLGGGRSGRLADVPDAPEDHPWTVRPAAEADLEILDRCYAAGMERYLIACRRDADLWAYDLRGRSAGAVYHRSLAVVERDGEPAGALVFSGPERGTMFITVCEIEPETGLRQGTLAALRHLRAVGGERASAVRLAAPMHPAFFSAPEVFTTTHRPYAWYLRVADLPALLRRVGPVLEWRLAESPFAGYDGTLRLNHGIGGTWLRLEEGRLADVGSFSPQDPEDGDAAYPDQSFLHLLFGRRSTEQLREARVDCWTSDDVVAGVLDALFPTVPSLVHAVG